MRGEEGVLLGADGMVDHGHLLVAVLATACLADISRRIKTNASKWFHTEWPYVRSSAWQADHAGFTVSKPGVDEVAEYLRHQARHHAK